MCMQCPAQKNEIKKASNVNAGVDKSVFSCYFFIHGCLFEKQAQQPEKAFFFFSPLSFALFNLYVRHGVKAGHFIYVDRCCQKQEHCNIVEILMKLNSYCTIKYVEKTKRLTRLHNIFFV